MGKIIVAGIGPGSELDITPAVMEAISSADAVVGYKYYFRFIQKYLKDGAVCLDTGMKQEKDRAAQAMELARSGKTVCVISSGDSGIYGMAPLLYQMRSQQTGSDVEIETLPGISAFQKAASLLGAPIGHDLCIISLSDLMTPWLLIEKRIRAAAQADFITAVYNPKSHGRYWQLYRLVEIFLEEGRSPQTPVGCVRQAGREDQKVWTTTLSEFDPEQVDMFTVVLIGNSQTYLEGSAMITPRGYYSEAKESGRKIGQDIMHESFRTIASELRRKDYPLGHKWALLHAIHTTADFDYADTLVFSKDALDVFKSLIVNGAAIVTDTNMALSGINKAACEKFGIECHCFMADTDVSELSKMTGFTRAVCSIDKAVRLYGERPLVFVIGNAPTALVRIRQLYDAGICKPAFVIGVPVGFVNVEAAKKLVLKTNLPYIVSDGKKGGSTIAAAIVNALLYSCSN